jgi:crotonobetainyl-CoA:carnitine CoA-transferase CaiB-like acyl-CoA transferase
LLAALGAEVIKVEHPAGGDISRTNPPYFGREGPSLLAEDETSISLAYVNRSRNKLSITLDLKDPSAHQVMTDLVKISDIVVENMSSGAIDRLGFGYAWAAKVNPAIVYCSISGFGSGASGSDAKSFDMVIQALSGVMDVTGPVDGAPTRVGIPIGDLAAPLFAIISILSALRHKDATGQGQFVDVSMLDTLTALVAGEHFDAMSACGVGFRTGNSIARMSPFGTYQTLDNQVAICAPSNAFVARLFELMDRQELLDDSRFRTRELRVKNRKDLDEIIGAWTATFESSALVQLLNASDVPAAQVRGPLEALNDERVIERKAVVPLLDQSVENARSAMGMGFPVQFSVSEILTNGAAPTLGQHNGEIYGGLLGYSSDRVREIQGTAQRDTE